LLGDDRDGETVERVGDERRLFGDDLLDDVDIGDDDKWWNEFGEYLGGVIICVWFLFWGMGFGDEG
jgi:hypothetical protein